MNVETKQLLDQYIEWLRNKMVLNQIDGWIEITTPFLDRHNDYMQIYARVEGGKYLLTDGGYILEDLEMSGCTLDSKKRQDILQMILNGFNVQLEGGALVTHASIDNFPVRKHNLIQAMLAVDDLFYLASPTVATLFFEDVSDWLDLHQIRYLPKVKFTGQSGFDHLFDFAIPKSSTQPERIVQAINRPNRENVENFTFAWVDTQESRPVNSRAYAILNDSEYIISSTVVEALQNYNIRPVLWSLRQEVKEELAA